MRNLILLPVRREYRKRPIADIDQEKGKEEQGVLCFQEEGLAVECNVGGNARHGGWDSGKSQEERGIDPGGAPRGSSEKMSVLPKKVHPYSGAKKKGGSVEGGNQ